MPTTSTVETNTGRVINVDQTHPSLTLLYDDTSGTWHPQLGVGGINKSANYVWDTEALAWVVMTQSGAGAGVSGAGNLSAYAVNNFIDGSPMYVGKVRADGAWLIQKYSTSTGEMVYANVSNNISVTTYAAAWSGRASLTYSVFQNLTGV